jgi:hypothetical protein
VGVLRLFKDGDPVVEHDDGEDCNLFDLGEPESAACMYMYWVSDISQPPEDLPATNAHPCASSERHERVLVVISKETVRAEFIRLRPVLGCVAYHYMAVDKGARHSRLWCIASTIATIIVPLGIGRLPLESV